MNKDNQYTPGPWRVEGEMLTAGAKHVAMVNYFDCGPGDPRSITKDEHEANANLIAAAPFMIKVLEWLDNEMDCRDDDFYGALFTREDFQQVRYAIKLARGKGREGNNGKRD